MLLALPLICNFPCLCELSTHSMKQVFSSVCTVIHKYKLLLELLPMQTSAAKRTRIDCPLGNMPVLSSYYLKIVFVSY